MDMEFSICGVNIVSISLVCAAINCDFFLIQTKELTYLSTTLVINVVTRYNNNHELRVQNTILSPPVRKVLFRLNISVSTKVADIKHKTRDNEIAKCIKRWKAS